MSPDPEPPLADRYVLGELLGAGGMADVHRATDLLLGREVAVKLLRPRPDDAEAAERFGAEARTLAAVNDPHVITILDVSLPGAPRPYLVMELLEGPSLSQRLGTDGALDEPGVRALGLQLARGIAAAHACGIVHRDVKPSNILFRPDGTAVLTDFGISRVQDDAAHHTPAGRVIGSPAYLAPEQVRGLPATAAVDVYALGLVLLESWTGVRAYPGPAVEAALARLSVAPAMPASLPRDLRDLLGAMTAVDPDDRPTAEEAAHLLDPGVAVVPHRAALADDPDVDVLTEEIRLPLGPVDAETAATADLLAAPPVSSHRRRTVLTAVATGAAVLALAAGPLGLGGRDDDTARPEPPGSPVAELQEDPVTPTASPSPSDEKSVATRGSSQQAQPSRTATTKAGQGKSKGSTGKKKPSGHKPGKGSNRR